MCTGDGDRLKQLTSGPIEGHWRVDSVVAGAVDKADAVGGSSVYGLEAAVLYSFIRRGKGDLAKASMPAASQGRSTGITAMVAMLRLVLVGTLGACSVEEGEAFSTFALLLASVVVEVERSFRLGQLTAVDGAAAKEKLARIGGIQDGVYRNAQDTLREHPKAHEHGHMEHRCGRAWHSCNRGSGEHHVASLLMTRHVESFVKLLFL
jgi:hypothetical protein